jgi:hypothetical protein
MAGVTRSRSLARRISRTGVLGAAVAFALGLWAAPVWAQQASEVGPPLQLRLYVNALTAGKITKTPADPNGTFSGNSFGSNGATLEFIILRHAGLSVSQQFEERHTTSPAGVDTKEDWVNTYYSLTAYVFATGHGRGNIFAGYSTGTVDRYTEKQAGMTVPPFNPARNLPLTRTFAGLDYTFNRIGFRAEWVQSEAADKISGQKVNLNQMLQVLSVYIPFN